MIKSILVLLISFFSIFTVDAQDQANKNSKISLGLGFSFLGKYNVIAPNSDYQIVKYSSESFYSLGLSCSYKIKKMLEIELGFYYNNHLINLDSPYDHPTYFLKERIELIEIPINIRFELKYFYISSGLLLDFQNNKSQYIDKQTGVGLNTAVGINYNFKPGISVYAGAIGYFHTAISIEKQMMIGISPQVGIRYHIK